MKARPDARPVFVRPEQAAIALAWRQLPPGAPLWAMDGRPILPDTVRAWITLGCKRAGVPRFTPHNLPLSLGDEPEQLPVRVEGPRQPMLDDLETGFVVPVEEARADAARRRQLVGQFDGGVAVPLDAHDLYGLVQRHAPHDGPGSQASQSCHPLFPSPRGLSVADALLLGRLHEAAVGGAAGCGQGSDGGGVLGGRVAAHHRGGGVPQQVRHLQLPRFLLDRPGGEGVAEAVRVGVHVRAPAQPREEGARWVS